MTDLGLHSHYRNNGCEYVILTYGSRLKIPPEKQEFGLGWAEKKKDGGWNGEDWVQGGTDVWSDDLSVCRRSPPECHDATGATVAWNKHTLSGQLITGVTKRDLEKESEVPNARLAHYMHMDSQLVHACVHMCV